MCDWSLVIEVYGKSDFLLGVALSIIIATF
jgi:hypothetical protein